MINWKKMANEIGSHHKNPEVLIPKYTGHTKQHTQVDSRLETVIKKFHQVRTSFFIFRDDEI